MRRRMNIRAILADPKQRKELMVETIIATSAREGITTTREQAASAYEKVQQELRRVVFLHGLESGPYGSKFRGLRTAFPGLTVTAPDCTGVRDPLQRRDLVLEHLEGQRALLVGSSLGGLVAALVADSRPELVQGLVLCAPALHWPETKSIQKVPWNTVIVHGEQDEVVPLEASRAFAQRFNVPLIVVQDGHRLKDSLDEILRQVRSSSRQATWAE